MKSTSPCFSRRYWYYVVCAIALSLTGVGLPATATRQGPPPDDLPPTTGGRSAGSRGCGLQDAIPLNLLLPPLNQAYTRSTRPTLAWFGNNLGQFPVEFRIYQYEAQTRSTQLVHELKDPETQKMAGLTLFRWPKTLAPLTPGVQYIWQVELICDRDRPSGNVFADAPIKVLEIDRGPQKPGYDALLPLTK